MGSSRCCYSRRYSLEEIIEKLKDGKLEYDFYEDTDSDGYSYRKGWYVKGCGPKIEITNDELAEIVEILVRKK